MKTPLINHTKGITKDALKADRCLRENHHSLNLRLAINNKVKANKQKEASNVTIFTYKCSKNTSNKLLAIKKWNASQLRFDGPSWHPE